MRARRIAVAIAVALAMAGAAGCAGVPQSSPVQVLRQVGGGDEVDPPPAPVADANPLDLVRGFVVASSSSSDKHGAARRFLTPEAAQDWNDGAALTVLDGQIDTVPVVTADQPAGTAIVRIRGSKVGRLTAGGAFEAASGSFQSDLELTRRDGQWRISRLPEGVVVDLEGFRGNYKSVPVWFLDPVRRLAVADLRYVPSVPSRAQPARVIEMLLGGPSSSLAGSAATQLTGAELRANVAAGTDNAVVVDLTKVAPPDDAARRLLAAQVVLSLSEVNVLRVRLLVDGEPLVAGQPEWRRDDVTELLAEVPVRTDGGALVASGGRLGTVSGPVPAAPLPGPAGNGGVDARSAATTPDGQRLAVVSRAGSGVQLLVGRTVDGVLAPAPATGTTMTRPTWTPTGDEVWTVVDGRQVVRLQVGPDGRVVPGPVDAGQLSAIGPIDDLRLSRDGIRLIAVVGGGLYTGALVRGLDGTVAVSGVRQLRSASLGTVVAADWRSTDSIVAITRNPGRLVAQVTVDGLVLSDVPTSNLTPPLTALAASPDRPLLVTDQTGVWTFAAGVQDTWRQVLSSAAGAVPAYPG